VFGLGKYGKIIIEKIKSLIIKLKDWYDNRQIEEIYKLERESKLYEYKLAKESLKYKYNKVKEKNSQYGDGESFGSVFKPSNNKMGGGFSNNNKREDDEEGLNRFADKFFSVNPPTKTKKAKKKHTRQFDDEDDGLSNIRDMLG